MRKTFLPLLICALTANTAEAGWKTGFSTECFRYINGAKQSTVQYYFCGNQKESCAGLKHISSHKPSLWYYHGEDVDIDGTKYWCCDGNKTDQGKFVAGAKWIKKSEDVTIDVGGGTCTYQKTTNVCGSVESDKPCTVPTSCPSGQVVSGGKCAAAKQETPKTTAKKDDTPKKQATEPEKPKEETTKTADSGKKITASAECKSTEYKSPLSNKCVSKSKNVQYSSDMMHECYGCSSDVRFKNCLNIYRAAPDKPTSTQEGTLKACNVTYAAADAQLMKSELVGKLPVFAKLDLPNSIINKKLTETAAIKISDDELKKALEQQMQVADVVVADQVMADDISTVTKTTGTTATTGTSVATGTTSIEDALKDIALPTATGTFVAPTKKLDFSVSKMQAM